MTITSVGGTIRVRWDTRVVALPLMGHATASYYEIACPADGATLGAGTVNADGINLGQNLALAGGYNSLWYVLPTGSSNASQPLQFRVVNFQTTTETPGPNWVLICATFTDSGQLVIRWQAGGVALPTPDIRQSHQSGSTPPPLGARGVHRVSDGSTVISSVLRSV